MEYGKFMSMSIYIAIIVKYICLYYLKWALNCYDHYDGPGLEIIGYKKVSFVHISEMGGYWWTKLKWAGY